MEPDDLQKAWAAHGAALDRSVCIDERLLRETLLRKVRFALAPGALWLLVEVLLAVVVLGALAPVVVARLDAPRYALIGGALLVFGVALLGSSARLLVQMLRIDLGGSVAAMQQHLERLCAAEFRALKWALLGGVVFWLPAALLLFELGTGVDALARVDLAWLVANLLFGLAVLVAGHVVSRRYIERADLRPWARRLVDALSGRGLRAATGHLQELAAFAREPEDDATSARRSRR